MFMLAIKPKYALKVQHARKAIAVLCVHFKKRGFDLESTYLRDRRKIHKLLIMVTLAFLFALRCGLLLKENTQQLRNRQKRKLTHQCCRVV